MADIQEMEDKSLLGTSEKEILYAVHQEKKKRISLLNPSLSALFPVSPESFSLDAKLLSRRNSQFSGLTQDSVLCVYQKTRVP